MASSLILNELMDLLPEIASHHSPLGKLQPFLKKVARREIEALFADQKSRAVSFPICGKLRFPYFKMGAVDSLNLFDIDELIIFSFYWLNRTTYRKVVDIGANIGLHSIILNHCGYKVRCFEPDPVHFKLLQRNLALNDCKNVIPENAAVSSKTGVMEFIRVLGNTTGSHIAGSKTNPYGKLEKFPVKVEAFKQIVKGVDLMKIDAEGHEREILLSTDAADWRKLDVMIEVQNIGNARTLFAHFKKMKVNLFAQKINWQQVKSVKDMPVGYKEGSLFITSKSEMPWHSKGR